MLKKRIMASLVLKNNIVVQSIGFNRYLPVGSLKVCIENLNRWGIDEIAIVDIDATKQNRTINKDMIKEATKTSYVPISVGGGLKTTDQIEEMLKNGADKIILNSAFIENPELITKASEKFGAQCVIVSLDSYDNFCYDYRNKITLEEDILSAAKRAVRLGAGEILLNCVQRDGMKNGLDIENITNLSKHINIPLIAQGGVGHAKHIQEGLDIENLCAVSVGNFFHFSEHSVNVAKGYIKSQKPYPIRNETYANYIEHSFDADGRVKKISDEKLSHMWFEFHPEEII